MKDSLEDALQAVRHAVHVLDGISMVASITFIFALLHVFCCKPCRPPATASAPVTATRRSPATATASRRMMPPLRLETMASYLLLASLVYTEKRAHDVRLRWSGGIVPCVTAMTTRLSSCLLLDLVFLHMQDWTWLIIREAYRLQFMSSPLASMPCASVL
jgi:hypothetical protein